MKTKDNKLTSNAQKQAQVMQAGLQLLPLIMNNIPQAVFWKDRDLVYLGCNQAFAEDTGFSSPEEIVGKTDFDMPWKDQAELYRADDRLVMEKGEPKLNYEEPQTTPNGSTIWLNTSKIPMTENGQIVAVLGMYEDITARKQAEADLLLRDSALSSSLNAVIIVNISDNKPIYVNDALLKMTGYTREEAMQIGLSDITGNAEEPNKIRSIMKAQGSYIGEELIKRKDGSIFPANFFTSLIIGAAGRPVAVQTSFFDISERKQAEEALRKSQLLYQSLVEVLPMSICRKDLAGRFTFANQRFLDVSQITLADLVGKLDSDLHPAELADKYRRDDLAVMESGQVQELIEERVVHGGGTAYVQTIKAPLYDETGKISGIQISFWDITDRKQAEEAIQASEERFRRFTEATNEGLVFHEQGRIVDANPAALAMFGLLDPTEFIGQSLLQFLVPESHEMVLKQMQLENVLSYEVQCLRKDRSIFPVETSTRTYKIDDRTIRATSIRDITERKQADARLRTMTENAPEAILVIDLTTGLFTEPNENAVKLYALSREELLKVGPADMSPPTQPDGRSSTEKAMEKINAAMQGEKPVFEWVHRNARGEDIPCEIRLVRLPGDLPLIRASVTDISERKRVEAELRQNELLLSNAIQIARMGYWDLDIDTQMFIFNDQYYRTFHATTTEEMGGNQMSVMDFIQRFVPPGQGDIIGTGMQEAIETKDPNFQVKLEAQNLTVQGELRWVSVWLTVEKDAQGRTITIHGVNQDITERKRAEQALQESQRLLQLVMDNIPQAVFWKDKELTYLGTNQAFAEDAGFNSPQELVGKTDFDMPWKEQAELYRADDQRILELGEAKLNYEEPQTGPTGKVTWLRTSKIPMRDINGKIFAVLGMYEDITEWKRLQQDVQAAFERRGYQVQVSTEISQEVAAASELNDLFNRVVTLTKERLGYYHTQLLRYDPAQDSVVLITGYGETGQKMLADGHQLPMGTGLIGTAAANGETVMRPNLADDPDWQPNPLLAETKGEIAVPIKWQNTVLGVLDVQSDQAGAITEDDRILLEGLCGQIAIAMHSAELVEAVRQNEARLAEALRAARLANWEYDVEKDIFTFNDEFYSIFHTTAEKAGGYQISSARYAEIFVHPDDMQVVGIEIGKGLSSTERVYNTTIDHRIRYEDGGVGYITVKLTVERDENGKITRYHGANQDITERKQAEEALRQSEARLTEALHAAKLAYWEHNLATNQFQFNDQYYAICHTTAEQEGGYTMSPEHMLERFIHPEDHALINQAIAAGLQSTDRHFRSHVDHRVIYADGSGIGHAAIETNIERDEQGHITRIYGSYQDITERIRQQQEMAERLEEVNRLYQSMSHEGWKTYRDTADLPAGFIYDQAGIRSVDEEVLADELFDNLPMRVLGGEVVGTLTIAHDPQHPTSSEDYAFLQQVSDQIALALESARLFDQTQSALAQSEKLFQASSQLTQAADLQELVEIAAKTMNIPVVNRAILDVFNYNSAGDLESMDVAATWWNGTGHEPTPLGTHYSIETLRVMSLFISPTPVFFSDAFSDERFDQSALQVAKSLSLRSGAVLPLHGRTRQIGVLFMEAEEPHTFTSEEVRLFEALAPQITTVLENRRQFERAQKQAERESTLNIISQKIQGATSVEAVLQIAARELGHALGAPRTIAQLSIKDKK